MLLLAGLVGLTVSQSRVWRSNLTLWTHATRVSPLLARPAINRGVAARLSGDPTEAARWLTMAGPLTARDVRGPEYRRVIARELGLLETFGTFVCDQPATRPYC